MPRRGELEHPIHLYLFGDEFLKHRLTQHGFPEKRIVVGALPPLLQLVLVVNLGVAVLLAQHHVDNVAGLESLLGGKDCLEGILHLLAGWHLRFGVQAVVAAAAIGLVVVFTEVAQQIEPPAHRRLGIAHHFLHQLVGQLLLGDILVGKELVEFLHILFGVEGNALSLSPITAGTTGLLVVALQALGNVVVDNKAHVGLVYAHAESDSGNNDIPLLHQELVLILGAHLVVQASVVGQSLDAVELQQLGQVLHLLAGEAIDDAALALVLLHKLHNLLVQLDGLGGLGSYLII